MRLRDTSGGRAKDVCGGPAAARRRARLLTGPAAPVETRAASLVLKAAAQVKTEHAWCLAVDTARAQANTQQRACVAPQQIHGRPAPAR
jgi:hypothetical protein